jgi:putative cofactor-binding repeat protein
MEVVFHNTQRDDTNLILDRIATQESEEDNEVGICVEDDAAVDGNLKDMLKAFPVKLTFWCHFSIV